HDAVIQVTQTPRSSFRRCGAGGGGESGQRRYGGAVAGRLTSSGYYTVPLLPPGNYRIVVQAAGFKSAARSGVGLAVARVARMDFRLEVGAVTERVEVAARASRSDYRLAGPSVIRHPFNQTVD